MTDEHAMTDREQRVRDRAHRLWEEAGRPHGQDERFWHEAEAEVAAAEQKPQRRS